MSAFTALLVGVTSVAGSVPNGLQIVFAKDAAQQEETPADVQAAQEEALPEEQNLQENETVSEEQEAAAEEESLPLSQDSQSPDVYYNSGSSMTDFRDETIYFVMTTRFYDGDSTNNVQCWDAQDKNAGDEPWRGDFKGLIEKLDYIKALGFTAIWITPVVENASGYDYHGYHAINFSKVDPRYESSDCTYQDLIDEAHARGMKVIQDVVFNHTGNWGEENLYKIAHKDYSKDLSDAEASMVTDGDSWPSNYASLDPNSQFQTRVKLLTTAEYDTGNIYHHYGGLSSWENYDEQIKNIAGDCLDLNTENPVVYHYLVDAYSKYIEMGVDAFRVDTVKHVSRLTFYNALISQLNDAYNQVHGTTGEGNFYMFGEVCTRVRDVWNKGIPALSCPFYTWKESKSYAWDDSETTAAIATNEASVAQAYEDHDSIGNEPTSQNALLSGNTYHTPDYSKASGLNVIDFPMHWSFQYAQSAFAMAVGNDQYYNDATFNVTYVDSHDYAPDQAPENQRFAGSQAQWAENLSLMFTFRGIPCIYYGSEVEFQKGCKIDDGTNTALANTGRAYFGDYIEGDVEVAGFGRYRNATGAMAESLAYPLSQHIQRLNRLRAAIPALRKGQYSTEGCNGTMAFKRRYTDATTDSFALVTISGDATFSGIPNGTYTDAITGNVINVTGGTLTTSGCSTQGDLRVYVLDTSLTPAPAMIDGKSQYMSGGTDALDFSRVETPVSKVEVTGLTLDQTSASMDLGDTLKLTATIAPSNASSKGVTWTTGNSSIATVSGGKVTAVGEGTTTITATSVSNKSISASATITVAAKGIKVTSVTLDQSKEKIKKGSTLQLTAIVNPANADAKYAALTWSSSDASVAKVDANGVVTAVGAGSALITVKTAMGPSAQVTITVKDVPVNMHVNALYFEKPSNWSGSIYAYMWVTENGNVTYKNGDWPGVKMTALDENAGIYGIAWPDGQSEDSLNVIFNVGSDANKTGDLKATMNGYYNGSGTVLKVIDPNAQDEDDEDDITPIIPGITASLASGSTITGVTNVTYTLTNAASGSYQVGSGEVTAINGSSATVSVGGNMSIGETVTVKVSAVSTTGDAVNEQYSYTLVAETECTEHEWNTQETVDIIATCTDAGSKSVRCKKCGVVKPGSQVEIPALGHTGGTAGCSVKAVCTRCGQTYGDYNSANHLHTELVNAAPATCQTAGYTGDTRCKDCGKIIQTGTALQKKAHSWNAGVVTKAATATSDGVKTYTCTVCGETKTEVISKTGTGAQASDQQTSDQKPSDQQPTVGIETGDGKLQAGDPVMDSSTGTMYRVTKAGSSSKTVEYALANSSSKTIVVPDNIVINGASYKVTSIAGSAFKNNKTIQSVTVGSNVKTIDSKAFYGCKNLEKIVLAKNVTSIGSKAFYKCTKLKSITIPEKVSKIGSSAFYGCKSLKSITIKTTKLTSKKVGSKAFKGTPAKATVKVPKKKLSAYKKLLKAKGVSSKATIKK